MERATVRVTGVVQSVGFRPFVYRRALAHELRGTVHNRGGAGVRIELEGANDSIDAMLDDLREEPPPLASVDSVSADRERVSEAVYDRFEIVDSSTSGDGSGTIPPDTAICAACLEDVRDPDSRYQGYWATACLNCGPRFTVIDSLPYDRSATSMAAFPMCEACREEYEEPTDRRYHAQSIACPDCGPRLRYGETSDDTHPTSDAENGRDPFPETLENTADGTAAIERAATTLNRGETVVLKGIGGAHLACDATNAAAVARLRERIGRPEKPFAVMAPDVAAVGAFASLAAREQEALESPRRPIVLLEHEPSQAEDDGLRLATGVAPGLHTVGTMLPYSGVHYLLFEAVDTPLVLTSANRPGNPMRTANGPLVASLGAVADGFVLHDRRIAARCDDSLVRVVDGNRRLLRRSRGFTPTPVSIDSTPSTPILGTGADRDAAAGVLHEGDCYLTQYLGDIDGPESLASFESAVDHLLDVTGLEHPPIVAHDAHPAFETADYARRLVAAGPAERSVAVQHHHAHAASVLAEHGLERAVALTLDGLGYGPDGTLWGGEVLDASLADFERVGGLAPVPMLGGDRATRYPGRMAAALLYARESDRVVDRLERHDVSFPGDETKPDDVVRQLESGENIPLTSSTGRVLDAVAALLDVCDERRYEGEPAMKLEALAADGKPIAIDVPTARADGRPVVDTPALFATLVELREAGHSRSTVAATAQDVLARGLADLAISVATARNRKTVALTGGVAYNDHIATRIRERVTSADLELIVNKRVPAGDGGIAYGQLTVAATRAARDQENI
ncbi:carbamoyltransferase HypF [Natronococcus sp. A-GB7]|uniref:carbamoyltransferase HypF n=1 Tax=Natronococcus sp. A-GB7 TaxID=3037649 RepID=UPI00241C4DD1|nr:carbamoyltransferase HypF [Natronococcus sp. A-GB7]MDG5821301.1 carbamoyltransferase HypF [Natronococcus sp. A-GB7]